MEFRKDKGLYVMPTIFLILSSIALLICILMLRNNKPSVIILSAAFPTVILLISLVMLITRVCARDLRFKIDDDHIYVGDLIIDYKAIDFLRAKGGLFVPIARPNVEIVLKSGELISISRVARPYDAIKLINKKYLKLKGPGVR